MNTLSGLRSYDTVLTLDGLSQFDSSIQTQALLIDGSNAMESDLNANGHVVKNLDIGVNASDSCTYGQMTTADSALSTALTASYTAADTAQTTAITAAYTAANTAQTTAITAAYTAADNLRLLLTGGVMSGTVSSTTVTTPFDYKNPNGTIIAKLEAGTSAVTNTCTLQMASNASSTLEFLDNASNVKSQLKYTYGAPGSLAMVVAGVNALSTSSTAATFNVPVTLNSPATVAAHAVRYDQMQAADNVVAANATAALTVEVNARVAAVAAEASTRASQDAALTTAYIAADTVVTNNSVQKTGSTMSGTLTINNIQTFLQATHTAASSIMTMQGGSSSVPNAADIKMIMGTTGGLEFRDYTGARMGYMRYDVQNTPDQIDFNVGGISPLLLQSAVVICTQPLVMTNKQITQVLAGTNNDHAINKGQMDTADGLRLLLTGGTLTGALSITSSSTTPLTITSSAANTTTVSGATTCNLKVLGATNPAISIGNNVGGTFAQFLYNTTSDLLSYLRWGVEYMSASATALTIKLPIVRTAWVSGETIQRLWMNPSLGNTLNNTSITTLTNAVLVTTPFNVTGINNNIIIRTAFEINATGGSNDKFRIVYEFGSTPQTITFNHIFATTSGWRTRMYANEYMFQPSNLSNPKTILARLYNDTDDTISVSDLNWTLSVEEVQL